MKTMSDQLPSLRPLMFENSSVRLIDLTVGDSVRYSVYPLGHDILGTIEETPQGCDTEHPYIIRTHLIEMERHELQGMSDVCYLENTQFLRIVSEARHGEMLSCGAEYVCGCDMCRPASSGPSVHEWCYHHAAYIDSCPNPECDGFSIDAEGSYLICSEGCTLAHDENWEIIYVPDIEGVA
tara:strand:- start:631 stop:1173 length:543 start_codon:yes stop_codon:yes gene_type:complete